MKSQYQQSFTGNHQTDELIQKIDQAGKLSELPEKAFDNLIAYIVKQQDIDVSSQIGLQFVTNLKKMTKNESISDKECYECIIILDNTDEKIKKLPQKPQIKLIEYQNKLYENGMRDFMQYIEKFNSFSEFKQQSADILELLMKLASTKRLEAHEIEKLLPFYQHVVNNNELARAMPDDLQAVLETYIMNKNLQAKLPSLGNNVTELFNMLEDGKELKIFQTTYLLKHIKKNQLQLSSQQNQRLENFMKKIDSNILKLAEDFEEPLDNEMLEALGRVVIQLEQEHNLSQQNPVYYELEQFGNNLVTTTAEGEFRARKTFHKVTCNNFIEDAKSAGIYDTNFLSKVETLMNGLRTHWGRDVDQIYKVKTSQGESFNNGTAYYVPDERIKGENLQSYITWIAKDTGNDGIYSIYIVEANYEKGVAVSIYRHLQTLHDDFAIYRDAGGYPDETLTGKRELGSYKIENTDTNNNKHAHLEILFVAIPEAKKEGLVNEDSKVVIKEILSTIEDFNENKQKPYNKMEVPLFKAVEVFQNNSNDDYIILELFTPGTPLNQYYREEIAKILSRDINHAYPTLKLPSIEDLKNNANKKVAKQQCENFMKEMFSSADRNQIQLEAIATILTHAKFLLVEIGESNNTIDRLIQDAHRVNIMVRESLNKHSQQWQETVRKIGDNI